LSDIIQQLTPRGLERRLKRQFNNQRQQFFAIVTPGFEQVLADELKSIGDVEISDIVFGGVEFSGDYDLVYKANLFLRTANRVLMRISTFTARSYPELYNKSRKISWELYTGFSKEVSLSVSSKNSRLHHSDNIATAIFDALRDSLEKTGVKVVLNKQAALCFHVRYADDICTISIDSSGELLYKRGYRVNTALAPIRETLASAILLEAECVKYSVIRDPMCGSGTFILEAALMAAHRAPGIDREFAFSHWPNFNEQKWDRVKNFAIQNQIENRTVQLIASDINGKAIIAIHENLSRLGFTDNSITIKEEDCLKIQSEKTPGLLVSNLPYGKRVGAADAELCDFYRRFGAHLRESFRKWSFCFVVADTEFERHSGLKSKRVIRFVNGGLPVRLVMGTV
jgi:putative N6-adenine-specific DNA methylase